MKLDRHVALIGARGCGKTTVGRTLARWLEVEFVDTDDEIVKLCRRADLVSAGDVLRALGEPAFRELEARALAAVLARTPGSIVATGGGIVLRAQNRELLSARARVAWLIAAPNVLARRLRADPTSRPPLLRGGDAAAEIGQLLAEREPLYQSLAEIQLMTDAGRPEELAQRLRTWLEDENNGPEA